MRDDGSASSWLDHFICDTSFAPDLSLFHRLDFGSNLSDHSPLACSLQVDLSVTPPSPASMQSTKSRIAWHAANSGLIRSYCDLVSHHLLSFPNSICDCCDPQCTVHTSALDWFCEQLSLCLHQCALSTLPTVCHSSSVPGWNAVNSSLGVRKWLLLLLPQTPKAFGNKFTV